MSQQGMVMTLPPRLDPEPWPQPGDGHHTPVYPRQLTMTLLYEAKQKDPFIRHLIQTYVKCREKSDPPARRRENALPKQWPSTKPCPISQ